MPHPDKLQESPTRPIRPGYSPMSVFAGEPLSAPQIFMNGNRLDIRASVDLAGLKQLKEMLTKFEGILEMMQPPKDEAAN